ncbi:GNAT family N-acetyltransferase [Virgibacillus oceani]|uniref:N-acetyltransferase n=1 Tax=Virgibacillus oceani TaxID=1479511 RepID=A0A917H966_9BACI|nr:GNAT family N-acetyltransferase [Virgibacillus oceani]GGG71635.1 N-acetyltransferase [Virgibacillus oceani]
MEIRKLNSSNADAYIEIRLEALQTNPEAFASSYEEEKHYSLEKVQNRLEDDYSCTIGAFENETLAGVVSIVREQRPKIKHRANIYAMYVTPEKRGSGIARKLMIDALEMVKQMNRIEQVYLSVVATNEPAKKLYKAFGFKTYGVDRRALKVNDIYYDEELMVLAL